MRWTGIGTLPYFLAGVAVGVFVDRLLGGPGTSEGLALVVAAVSAAFALSGPLLQERLRQGNEQALLLRAERKEHAAEVASTTLAWLGSISYLAGGSSWSASPTEWLEGVNVVIAGDRTVNISQLQYWRYAVEHFAADPDVGPAWAKLAESLQHRAKLKTELDRFTAQKLAQALEAKFGVGFQPGMSYAPDRTPRTYSQADILRRLRSPLDLGSIRLNTITFNPGPESPQEERSLIQYGPEEWASSSVPSVLELDRFKRMYTELRSDTEFRTRLAALEEQDRIMSQKVREFGQLAWGYYERVNGMKQIPGECGLCPRLGD